MAIQIANMSGLNGSYLGSVFTQIGIDNIPGNLANPANIVVSQNGAPVCTNKFNDPSPSVGCWTVKQDANASGGFNVDFLDQSSNGLNRDISSLCLNEPTLLYTCLASNPVTLSFDINSNFTPATQGQVYIHSETILPTLQYAVSECETGASVVRAERCVAATFDAGGGPVTATPEPATLALLGTGMFAVGGPVGFMRRRRKVIANAAA
ncbi:MAG: PEP-CTERM sorting domain-containing protein [bacterium]